MALSPQVERSLKRVPDERKQVELLRQRNLFPRRKLLLTGLSGCGKAMTAEVIANQLGLPLSVIRLGGLISQHMGKFIAKLRLIFDAMQEFRTVYLVDEFEASEPPEVRTTMSEKSGVF